MRYTYIPQGACSTKIEFDIEGDIIRNIHFDGGCYGNLQAVSRLVDGMTVSEIEKKLHNIICADKGTSCSHQLTLAVREAYEATQGQ